MESFYKITVLGKPINVEKYKLALTKIDVFFKSRNINYKLNGLYYNLMISQQAMIGVLLKSFLLALSIVSLIALLYLKSIKVFFIFLFVNVVPVFISLFILKITGLSLNIATVMTYSIALGMIVDSSFHLIHVLKEPDRYSFSKYFSMTVKPILGSSLLLVCSFALFAFNDFLPIKQFGINLSIILFVGMIFDFFVLPTLFLGKSQIKETFDGHNL